MINRQMFSRSIQILTVVVTLTILNACAVQSGSTSKSSKPSKSSKDEVIIVDSDVQQTFDRAVQSLNAADYDTAIELLNEVIAEEKRLTAPYINLAMAHRKKGDEKAAESNLMQALEIDLGDPVANNELGMLYRKQGKFADAKKAYTNALVDHPDYLPVIKNLGILCDLYMRDTKCALEQFEKYQDQQPDDKTIKIWIADLKARM